MDSKELWYHARECAIEEYMDVEEKDYETAARDIDACIQEDASFIEDYYPYVTF